MTYRKNVGYRYHYFRNKKGQIVNFRGGSSKPYSTGSMLIKKTSYKKFKVLNQKGGSSVLLLGK